MTITAVIGANFGDEGKGLLVDYLAARSSRAIVARFNGGAQAGNTVLTPEGRKHSFRQFGAGTLAGASTYLSEYFILNPLLWRWEMTQLYGASRCVHLHPHAQVTTPYDMILNQWAEYSRTQRYGSCGLGINETIVRSKTGAELRVEDLKTPKTLDRILEYIQRAYVPARAEELGLIPSSEFWAVVKSKSLLGDFKEQVALILSQVSISAPFATSRVLHLYNDIIMEGAQGLLLDEQHPYFPHVTRSRTGLHNIRQFMLGQSQLLKEDFHAVYVTRPYLTRHGAGPFPTEVPLMAYPDDTNRRNTFQGLLRFGTLNVAELVQRVKEDAVPHGVDFSIAVTHLDQVSNGAQIMAEIESMGVRVSYSAYGPSRNNVIQR